MNNNHMELINKIKKLAEQGVGGEKINAQTQLKKLMKKYNLTEKDIEEDKEDIFTFKFSDSYSKELLIYVMCTVMNCKNFKHYKKGKAFTIFCTSSQAIQIENMYEIYIKDLKDNLSTFLIAYLMKNDLVPEFMINSKKESEFTQEELEKMAKRAALQESIEKKQIRIAIESK